MFQIQLYMAKESMKFHNIGTTGKILLMPAIMARDLFIIKLYQNIPKMFSVFRIFLWNKCPLQNI